MRRCVLFFSAMLIVLTVFIAFAKRVNALDVMKAVPVPQTVSPEPKAYISQTPLLPHWNAHPKDSKAWKALIRTVYEGTMLRVAALKKQLGVRSVQERMGAYRCIG